MSGSAGQDYILESMSAGAAFFDYDGDGYLDLLAVNGTTLADPPAESRNRLFHNERVPDGGARVFREVTGEAGLGSTAWGMGCAVGDYDNDDDPDVYLTYWGPNQLFRNDGAGIFADVSGTAGVADPGWGSSAAFGDLDGDGLLDLYVVNYVEFDLERPPAGGRKWLFRGQEVFYGPKGIPAQVDRLYRNDGDGVFSDVSLSSGIASKAYPGLGVTFGDFDSDGDLDVYVANDSEPNQLFRNDGDWTFADVGVQARVAYTEDGRSQAGMGVHGGDYDSDGDLDLFVTNFSEDVNTLYRNEGDGQFVDVTARAGLDGTVRPLLGFGTAFFDYDNDGWLDLFVANGHVYPQVDQAAGALRYGQRNLLYRNVGGRFREVGEEAGPDLLQEKVSRASAFGDYDNDGDVDIFVMDLNDRPALLRNDGGNRHQWLGLRLRGTASNRDAIGASVRVTAGDLVLTREVQRGYGFQSQHDPRLLFGLATSRKAVRVEIRWPSGARQVFDNLPLRRYIEIREGSDDIRPGAIVAAPERGNRTAVLRDAPLPAPPDSLGGMSAEQLYHAGRSHHEEGRLQASVHALAASARRNPRGLSALFLLGRTLLSLNRDEDAIVALEQARALEPSDWRYANGLGVAYRRLGRPEDALAALRDAAKNAPWAPQPHLNLARLYDDIGQPHAAVDERRMFAQLRPLQHKADLGEDLLSANPEDARVHVNLGLAYTRQGRLADALARFERACALDAEDGRARYGLGDVYHRQNRLDEAIEQYERALEIRPDDPAIHTSLGMAFAARQEYDAASARFDRALELDPGHASAHVGVGKLHMQERNAAAAVKVCERAVKLSDGHAAAYGCLGNAHAALGRHPQAIDAFERALELDARTPQIRYALGLVYHLQGRFDAAIGEWERLLQIAPDHAKARRLMAEAERKLAAR